MVFTVPAYSYARNYRQVAPPCKKQAGTMQMALTFRVSRHHHPVHERAHTEAPANDFVDAHTVDVEGAGTCRHDLQASLGNQRSEEILHAIAASQQAAGH